MKAETQQFLRHCFSDIDMVRFEDRADLLSDEDAELLATVGIPKNPGAYFSASDELEVAVRNGRQVVLLGGDYGSVIGIVAEDRSLHGFSRGDGEELWFVNSSLSTFLYFMCHYLQIQDLADSEFEVELGRLRMTLTEADPSAVSRPGTWWNLVWEQAEAGLV